MSSVMSDSGCRSLRDDLSLDRIRPLSWIKKSNPLHLPPTIFSRIDSPSDYYYRDGITSNLISRESASDPNSITACEYVGYCMFHTVANVLNCVIYAVSVFLYCVIHCEYFTLCYTLNVCFTMYSRAPLYYCPL